MWAKEFMSLWLSTCSSCTNSAIVVTFTSLYEEPAWRPDGMSGLEIEYFVGGVVEARCLHLEAVGAPVLSRHSTSEVNTISATIGSVAATGEKRGSCYGLYCWRWAYMIRSWRA